MKPSAHVMDRVGHDRRVAEIIVDQDDRMDGFGQSGHGHPFGGWLLWIFAIWVIDVVIKRRCSLQSDVALFCCFSCVPFAIRD